MNTFNDYKKEVSIAQVAEAIGFKFDKTKGKTQPVYKREDANGNKEEIVIKNPNDNLNQHYFDRNYKGGDVVNFIKNHLNEFQNLTRNTNNDFVKINMVLSHFAKIPYTPKLETYTQTKSEKELQKDRYNEITPKIENLQYLIKERKLDQSTIERFLPFIKLIQDNQSKGNYVNIAFPYQNSKSQEPANYEIRNHGYKGMAAGGDKETSTWIATNAENKALVKNVILSESAIDAMSFYELKKNYYKLANSAFISVGGYVSKGQVQDVINQFPNARINTAFDNDKNGRLYDIITYAVAIGKNDIRISKNENDYQFKWDNKSVTIPANELSLNRFKEESGLKHRFGTVFKPSGEAKDFNEQLQIQKNELSLSKSESKSIKP